MVLFITTPEQLFSVTVLGPDGAPAKIAKGQEGMYSPISKPADLARLIGYGPMFQPIPPLEDVSISAWRVGDDFDMSAPGVRRQLFLREPIASAWAGGLATSTSRSARIRLQDQRLLTDRPGLLRLNAKSSELSRIAHHVEVASPQKSPHWGR
jgi:hypothetical protein